MAMAMQVTRHQFTVDEYHRMSEAGVFGEDDRVELIEGDILEMAPIGSRHAACVTRLNRLLSSRLASDVIVRVQDPILLDDGSEPQPDVVVARFQADFYESKHPGPRDLLLVIEVAESSLGFDRDVKMGLYARARDS